MTGLEPVIQMDGRVFICRAVPAEPDMV